MIFLQAGICRFNIAKKLSHYSDGFGLEHPAVKAAMEELKALYGEYLDSLEEIAKRFNEA